jgi:hypothetical protein
VEKATWFERAGNKVKITKDDVRFFREKIK